MAWPAASRCCATANSASSVYTPASRTQFRTSSFRGKPARSCDAFTGHRTPGVVLAGHEHSRVHFDDTYCSSGSAYAVFWQTAAAKWDGKKGVRTLSHLSRKGGSAVRHSLLLMAELPMHLPGNQSTCQHRI